MIHRGRKNLAILIVLIMLIQVSGISVSADQGVDRNISNENIAAEEAIDLTGAAAATEDGSGEDDAKMEETTENVITDKSSSGKGVRSGSVDITDYIIFTNGELTSSSGIINEGDTDIVFGYWASYTFGTDWSVDFAALAADGITLEAGDYFTFTVPDIFGPQTFTLGDASGVWATVEIDADGNGKVTFASAVEGKQDLSGSLELKATYKESTKDIPVEWTFEFGNDTFEYTGQSGGGDPIGNNHHYVKDAAKFSIGKSGDYYGWQAFINMMGDDWTGEVTIEDTLGPYHKMAPCQDSSASQERYGVDGIDYLSIGVIDWEQMREDYNSFVQYSKSISSEILWYRKPANSTIWKQSSYRTADEITSGYTSFMINSMRWWAQGSYYDYITPYTGGLESIEVTPGGYKIIFPDGALNEQSLVLLYYTELSSGYTPPTLDNDIKVTGTDIEYETQSTHTVSGSGSISGTAGEITIIKFDSSGHETLAEASFELIKETVICGTETTGSNGMVIFKLRSDGNGYAGTYTLTETAAPPSYTILSEPLMIEINSTGKILSVNGTTVSANQNTDIYSADNEKICTVINGGLQLHVYNHKAEKVSISGSKTWDDAENQAGKRPDSIVVNLLADDEPIDSKKVTANDNWTYGWTDLPKYADGEEIIYTVTENPVSEYDTEITGFDITNTYRPQISVSKINSAGSELSGASLTIYEADADGKATDVIAKDKDGKELTWVTTGEVKDITGIAEGTYILHEEAAPEGYYVAYDILFTVNADGTVTKDSAAGDIDGNTIIMTDLRYEEVMAERVALVIGKTVTGTAGDPEQEFTFTLKLFDKNGEEVTESFPYDGSKTGTIKSGESVKLKHGESIKIYDIPLDVQYAVVESGNEGYTVKTKNTSGTIDEIGRTAQFTNHKDNPDDDEDGGGTLKAIGRKVKTGDNSHVLLYGIIMLFTGMGIFILTLRHIKKKKNIFK